MARAVLTTGMLLLASACAPTSQERVHEFNRDGVRLFEKGSYDGARQTFETALAGKPGDPDILYNLGRCEEKLGRGDLAEQRYTACLQQAPDHAECRHALTVLLANTGRRDAAVQMVENWLRARPDSAAAYAEDGWLWHQAGDLPRAQGRLQQALERDSRNNRALIELALVYEDMHRPDRAIVLYERALAYQPDQPEIRARLTSLRANGTSPPRPD